MDLNRPFQTVTPTLDGDVLSVLATASEVTFTTGQVHRVLARHSEEGIRKALQRLSKQGTVLSTRSGNTYNYRLNRQHLAFPHIVGISGLFSELLRRLEARLAEWSIAPQYAAIFGSAARGTMSIDSDIDILLIRPDIVQNDDLWDEQVAELMADVSSWTGNDARDLQFASSEITGRGDEPVLTDVVREGITVAGSRAEFARMLRKRRVHGPNT